MNFGSESRQVPCGDQRKKGRVSVSGWEAFEGFGRLTISHTGAEQLETLGSLRYRLPTLQT